MIFVFVATLPLAPWAILGVCYVWINLLAGIQGTAMPTALVGFAAFAGLMGIFAAWTRLLCGDDTFRARPSLRKATAFGLAVGTAVAASFVVTLAYFEPDPMWLTLLTMVFVAGAFLLAATLSPAFNPPRAAD